MRRYGLVSALASGVAFAIFYGVAQSWSAKDLIASTDVLFSLVSGISAFLGFWLVYKCGSKGKLDMVFVGLSIGVFFWFLGETGWAVYEVLLKVEIPYPSVADLFYLSGYVPIIIGLGMFISLFRDALTRPKRALALLVGVAFVVSISIFLFVPLAESSSDLITKVLDLAYPILDSTVFVAAIVMLLIFQGGLMGRAWVWLAIGILLTTIADIFFSLGTLQGWYYSGHPIELLYLWGYISFGMGFLSMQSTIESPVLGRSVGA